MKVIMYTYTLLISLSISINASQGSSSSDSSPPNIISTVVNITDQIFGIPDSSDSLSTESDDEDLATTAIQKFYPFGDDHHSMSMRAYVLRVLRENSPKSSARASNVVARTHMPDDHDSSSSDFPILNARQILRRVKSGDETMSPHAIQEHNQLQRLLLQAADSALRDKEKELAHQQNELERKERKLEEKMSKKATIGWSAISGVACTLITVLTTYYSKSCSTS